jgi:hypothetical protein
VFSKKSSSSTTLDHPGGQTPENTYIFIRKYQEIPVNFRKYYEIPGNARPKT